MEVCTARGFSTLPPPLLPATATQSPIRRKTHVPFPPNSRPTAGRQYCKTLCLKSTTSEDTPLYSENEPQYNFRPVDSSKEEEKEYDNPPNGEQEGASFADNLQLSKFIEDLDLKVDFEDTTSVLFFGGGAAVALWLATAVVSAVDSIPLMPKVLELVGLGYTIWFSSRYLIFKKNRDELVAKVEQIKQQVLGSKGE